MDRPKVVKAFLPACLVVLASCGGDAPSPQDDRAAPDQTPSPAECEERGDPELDLSAEPDYEVDYLKRGTKEGCPVRLDVLMLRAPGPDFHCAPWPPEIVFGTSPGGPEDGAGVYVRDPEGWLGDRELAAGFEANARVPADAERSPYAIDGAALFIAEDGRAIYLKYDERTEKWPINPRPAGCA